MLYTGHSVNCFDFIKPWTNNGEFTAFHFHKLSLANRTDEDVGDDRSERNVKGAERRFYKFYHVIDDDEWSHDLFKYRVHFAIEWPSRAVIRLWVRAAQAQNHNEKKLVTLRLFA